MVRVLPEEPNPLYPHSGEAFRFENSFPSGSDITLRYRWSERNVWWIEGSSAKLPQENLISFAEMICGRMFETFPRWIRRAAHPLRAAPGALSRDSIRLYWH